MSDRSVLRKLMASAMALTLAASGLVAVSLVTAPPASAAPGPEYWIPTPTVNLGPVSPGGQGQNALYVYNTGTANLTGIAIGSPGDSRFAAHADPLNCPTTLTPGDSCKVIVAFRPKVGPAASSSTTFNVSSSAGTRAITLSGSVVAPLFPILFTTSGLDFGSIPAGGTSAAQVVTLTNVTTATVHPTYPLTLGTLTGFSVTNNCGTTISSGASCSYSFKFHPVIPPKFGVMNGDLPIAVKVGNTTRQVDVKLRGVGVPNLSISGSSLDFGEEKVGFASPSMSTTVTNIGTVSTKLTVTGFSANGAFVVADHCTNVNLAPTKSCTLDYTFGPTGPGTATRSDVLTFADPTLGTQRTLGINMTGKGVTGAAFPVSNSANSLDFGEVALGDISAPQTLTFTNQSGSSVTPVFTGLEGGATLIVTDNTCVGALASFAHCVIVYRYKPQDVTTGGGGVAASVKVGSTTRVFDFDWTTSALPSLRVSPFAFDLGTVPLGLPGPHVAINVTNVSQDATMALSGGTTAAPYAGSGPCAASLDPPNTCQEFVDVNATAAGPTPGNLTVSGTNAGVSGSSDSQVTFNYTGATAQGAAPYVDFPTLDFGLLAPNFVRQLTSHVMNPTGTTLAKPTVGAPGSPRFGEANSCTTVAIGSSCPMAFTFHPTAAGALSTTDAITTTSGPLTQKLQGTGAAAVGAVNDSAVVLNTTPYVVSSAAKGLLANDAGHLTVLTSHSSPAHGVVVTQPDGRWTYTATAGYVGPDSFTYQIRDAANQLSTATVSLTVRSITLNQAFVKAAYVDFLNRQPTAGELSTKSAQLDAATLSRGQLVDGLANSSEWISVIVNNLYQQTLGRPGDAGGVAYWVGKLQSGQLSVAEVAANFYASPEYYANIGGGTDASWLTDLYHKLLSRNPDSGGLSYWEGQTTATGRTSVALRFYQSSESCHARVLSLYQKLLGRAPDSAGADYWAGRVATDGDIALAANLAASTEYYTRASTRFV